jgi:antitoxin component YwqK of YwqJK toxin-antitoxin module
MRQDVAKIMLLILSSIIIKMTTAQVDSLQTDTTLSVYKDLVSKEYYKGNTSTIILDGVYVYRVNDKRVDKKDYDKYQDAWNNISTCKPCILSVFDFDGRIISKGIQYTDLRAGFRIEYFPNGRVKLIGHYKENVNGDWETAQSRGVGNKDGTWTYFNEKGEKLYSELWIEGKFIKQIPEQAYPDVWFVELMFKGEKITGRTMSLEEVREIEVKPKFKNKFNEGFEIDIEFIASDIGRKQVRQKLGVSQFKAIDLRSILTNAGYKISDKVLLQVWFYNHENFISYDSFSIVL